MIKGTEKFFPSADQVNDAFEYLNSAPNGFNLARYVWENKRMGVVFPNFKRGDMRAYESAGRDRVPPNRSRRHPASFNKMPPTPSKRRCPSGTRGSEDTTKETSSDQEKDRIKGKCKSEDWNRNRKNCRFPGEEKGNTTQESQSGSKEGGNHKFSSRNGNRVPAS